MITQGNKNTCYKYFNDNKGFLENEMAKAGFDAIAIKTFAKLLTFSCNKI